MVCCSGKQIERGGGGCVGGKDMGAERRGVCVWVCVCVWGGGEGEGLSEGTRESRSLCY